MSMEDIPIAIGDAPKSRTIEYCNNIFALGSNVACDKDPIFSLVKPLQDNQPDEFSMLFSIIFNMQPQVVHT